MTKDIKEYPLAYQEGWHDGYEEGCALMRPDLEAVSAKVHDAWMESKRLQGVETRKSEIGEELMVPYDRLSDAAKELDRGTVRAVFAAIEAASL